MRSPLVSPWVELKETPQERVKRLIEEGHEPQERTHDVEGFTFTLRVVVRTFEESPDALRDYTLKVFGACLQTAQAFKDFDAVLETRNISRDPKKVLGSKVKLKLGNTVYYAKASSHDLDTATAHAIDRLAAGLTELAKAHTKVQQALSSNGLTIIRKV